MAEVVFSTEELDFVLTQRAGRLATADAASVPHVVPVCFAYVDSCFWIAIDEKPKRTMALKRLRNIAENPQVSILFDLYEDDWSRLAWVMVSGTADVLTEGAAKPEVLAALRKRYPQYLDMALEKGSLIRVQVELVTSWRAV